MQLRRTIISLVVGLVAIAVVAPFAMATEYQGSVQSYSSDSAQDTGVIVELDGKDSHKVKQAEQTNLQNMFGVVVDRNQVPLTVSNPEVQNETYVAVSGTYNVLVNTQNGPIAKGDYVTLSLVNGVGMKAGSEEKTVFGRAVGSFDGKSLVLGTTELKDKSGAVQKKVQIGTIPVTINIQRNPNIKSTKADVPEFLEKLGQQIADKKVSPVRIYLSMAITAVSLIAAIVVLYSGVRNAIISIGRNPMSKKTIFRALLEIILTSILILIIGLFAVYLLLKL